MYKRPYFYIPPIFQFAQHVVNQHVKQNINTPAGGYFSQRAGYKGLNKAPQLAAEGDRFRKSTYGRRIMLELICEQKRHHDKNKQWADLKDNSAAEPCRCL